MSTSLGTAIYRSSVPTLSTGQEAELRINSSGALVVSSEAGSGATISNKSSSALEASRVLKSSPGTMFWFTGYIDGSAPTGTYYLQFFNLTAVPADATAVPADFVGPIAYNHATGSPTAIDLDFRDIGISGSVGLVVCLSSTQFTKTITSAYLAIVNAKIQ